MGNRSLISLQCLENYKSLYIGSMGYFSLNIDNLKKVNLNKDIIEFYFSENIEPDLVTKFQTAEHAEQSFKSFQRICKKATFKIIT